MFSVLRLVQMKGSYRISLFCVFSSGVLRKGGT
jgi:hypothetical protein